MTNFCLSRREFIVASSIGYASLLLTPHVAHATPIEPVHPTSPKAIGNPRWTQITIPLQDPARMHALACQALSSLLCLTGDQLPKSASSLGAFPDKIRNRSAETRGFNVQLTYPNGHTVVLAAGPGLSQRGEVILRGDEGDYHVTGTASWGSRWRGRRGARQSIKRATELTKISLELVHHAAEEGRTVKSDALLKSP
jgi:hypothetical protein